MHTRDSPKIGIKFTENNTSKYADITDKVNFVYIEFDYIIRSTNISKKQLNLYLWRHPEIETYKDGKTKYVSLEIFPYIFTSQKRKM